MQGLCGSGPCSLPRALCAIVAAYPAVVRGSGRITVALAPRDVSPRTWQRIQVHIFLGDSSVVLAS